jgi:hypothetical protein
MAITNQQIADLIQQSIDVFDRRLGQLVESFENVTASDRVEHGDFRRAINALATSTKLLQAGQQRHDDNWRQARYVVVAALVIPIVTAIVALVLK